MPDGDGAEALAVHIPDPNLEAAIREALGLPDGDLTPTLLASLEELHADGMDIESLSGLEFAVNLTTLNLNHNHTIVDLGPVAGLTRLEHLGFAHNQVTDLSPVANLTSLIRLTMDGNPVASFDPLVGIKSLTGIHANITYVSDISPLAHLPKLGFLALNESRISDVSPLAVLTDLGALHLRGNRIRDVSPLAGLSNLIHLDISNNQIADIAPLMGLTLRGLVLGTNPLNARTLDEYIPILLGRGVVVDLSDVGTFQYLPPSGLNAGASGETTPVQEQIQPAQPALEEDTVTLSPDLTSAVPATALIVGINAYDHHANLVNPTFDAQAVDKELREVFGCDTTTLLDATKLEFLEGLHSLADRDYAEDEQLMVFFSGHGYFDERIRRGYLAFKDSLPLEDDPYYQSFVSHEDVRVLLERLDCNHVLLVVDSCFSGTLDPMVAMAPGARAFDNAYGLIPRAEYIQRKLRYRTRRYITAGGKEYVSDGHPGQHSPFARQFLAALRTFGGSDGILTLEEILLHLERVDPQPRTGELFGNEPGSSFVLVARPVEEPTPSKFATLTVQVTPPNADVHVTGGPPPAQSLLKTLRVQEKAGERRFRLPQGQYQVRATLAGFHAESKDVQLTAQGHAVELLLERIEVRSDPVRPMAGRMAAETRIVSLPDGGGNMTFVWVPPGPFTMGGGEFPTYSATAEGFWIGAYEVTVEQFRAFLEANPAADAVLQLANEFSEYNVNAQDAVRLVSQRTANAFCEWAGLTLPTEEQWECAAKGGQNLTFATFDGQIDYGTDYDGMAVGAGRPNPFGAYDMSGNVWEWCLTVLPDRKAVLRGGADSPADHEWRTFHKYSWDAHHRSDKTGFRCILPSALGLEP